MGADFFDMTIELNPRHPARPQLIDMLKAKLDLLQGLLDDLVRVTDAARLVIEGLSDIAESEPSVVRSDTRRRGCRPASASTPAPARSPAR